MTKSQALYQYALLLKNKGLYDDAAENLLQAVSLHPAHREAHYQLGLIHQAHGDLPRATVAYRQALELNPGSPEVVTALTSALYDLAAEQGRKGLIGESETLMREVTALSPGYRQAYWSLGKIGLARGDHEGAWEAYGRAIELDPSDLCTWHQVVHAVTEGLPVQGKLPLLEGHLLAAMGDDRRDLDEPASIGLFFLKRDGWFADLLGRDADVTVLERLYLSGELAPLLNSKLLMRIMEVSLLYDPVMEKLLANVRKMLMRRALQPEGITRLNGECLPFLCSLAMLCFNNEYLFPETAEETDAYGELCRSIESRPLEQVLPVQLALIGAYLPLHALSAARAMTEQFDAGDGSPLSRLLTLQVGSVFREQAYRGKIKALTPIVGEVSGAVRAMYEENPFPRWRGVNLPVPAAAAEVLHALFPHITISADLDLEHPSILVAGCGTGLHPINTASLFKGARVTAIDLSLASLAFAMRKADDLGIRQIDFFQADILQLGDLKAQFDIIECGGVLHHLKDPVKGWRILLGLLRPGGVMGIALYSRLARRNINGARAHIAQQGFQPTTADMRRCRQALLENPQLGQVVASKDFYSLSGCRDLLLHVQEHQFGLEELAPILDDLGLEFLGFQVPDQVKAQYGACFPEDTTLTSLRHWGEFEENNPDTFFGMYQFWVRKRDLQAR
jgi:SAM-dependent methyltransferase/tetratricopeptide (TPR) repeat protein